MKEYNEHKGEKAREYGEAKQKLSSIYGMTASGFIKRTLFFSEDASAKKSAFLMTKRR